MVYGACFTRYGYAEWCVLCLLRYAVCRVRSLQDVVYGPFCVRFGVSGVRSAARVCGSWCVVCFVWFLGCRLWYVIGAFNMKFDLWYSLCGIWYVISCV